MPEPGPLAATLVFDTRARLRQAEAERAGYLAKGRLQNKLERQAGSLAALAEALNKQVPGEHLGTRVGQRA